MSDDLTIREVNGWPVGFRDGCNIPLMRDFDLGTKLRLPRPRKIRELIERMEKAGQLSEVYKRPTTGRYELRPGVWHPGQDATEYWLTEAQALKVTARSETDVADEQLDEMIAVYMAARRGELPQQIAATHPNIGVRKAELFIRIVELLPAGTCEAQRVANLAYATAELSGQRPQLPEARERWRRPTEIANDIGATVYAVGRAITALGLKERAGLSRAIEDIKTHGAGVCTVFEYTDDAVEFIRAHIEATPQKPARTKRKAQSAPIPQVAIATEPAPANDAPAKEDDDEPGTAA